MARESQDHQSPLPSSGNHECQEQDFMETHYIFVQICWQDRQTEIDFPRAMSLALLKIPAYNRLVTSYRRTKWNIKQHTLFLDFSNMSGALFCKDWMKYAGHQVKKHLAKLFWQKQNEMIIALSYLSYSYTYYELTNSFTDTYEC